MLIKNDFCSQRMMAGESFSTPPILQMVGVKGVSANPGAEKRYRLIVNDGSTTHSFVMLATSLNHLYESGDLSEHCLFQVDRFVPSKVTRDGPNDKQVLIVFNITVLVKGSDVGRQLNLGNKTNKPAAVEKENIGGNTSSKPYQRQQNVSVADTSFDPSSHLTMPIESLSPYHNKWVIKARVTAKSPLRTWNNAKGEGKLFSFDVCDETSEIRITAFRDMVDKFMDMIEIDKVYYISKCQIKPANKQYSKLKNDYEMTISSETVIQPCNEDTDTIPKLRYEFTPIAEIGEKEANSIVDVIAVCKDATDVVKLTAKTTGRELTKRDVTLVDQSNSSIVLTLWGDDAANFDIRDNPVIAIKSAQIKEFMGGKSLSIMSSTVLKINPDIQEGHQVRGWFENEGSGKSFSTLSAKTGAGGGATEFVTFHEVKERKLGSNQDKPDYFSSVGMIHTIKQQNMTYKACANGDCNKKVIENGDGTYRCEKCNVDLPHCKNRLLTNILFGDWTSNRWVTLFADIAEQVLGKNGDEIAQMMENEDKSASENYFNDLQFKPMMMKIRTKIEVYGVSSENFKLFFFYSNF